LLVSCFFSAASAVWCGFWPKTQKSWNFRFFFKRLLIS
jgi:hypothetical protein